MQQLCDIGNYLKSYNRLSECGTIIIALLILLNIATIFDIPLIRQILATFFCIIIPGFILFKILKVYKIINLEGILIIMGLSLSFYLFFGILLNNILISIGYKTPLQYMTILAALNISILTLLIIDEKYGQKLVLTKLNLNLKMPEKAFLVIPIAFPALSIFGMHIMNIACNNNLIIYLLILIPLYIIMLFTFYNHISSRLYAVLIYLISISLLLLLPLRSNHMIGVDVHTEYYHFLITCEKMHWSIIENSTLDSCISISLIPCIFNSIYNISSEHFFKILYPLVYSISPLVIYSISRRYIEDSYAFLASCFYMFQPAFLWVEYNPRTSFATLFFTLIIMILFSNKIDLLQKKILFIIFFFSCVLSHYSTTYIIALIFLGTFIGFNFIAIKHRLSGQLNLNLLILFLSFMFLWYSQITNIAFAKGLEFVEKTFLKLNMLFIEELRGQPAQALLGEGFERGMPYKIQFAFIWITFIYLAIGIAFSIIKYKEVSFPELKFKKHIFLKEKFETEYWLIAIICSAIAILTIALPFVSLGYGIERAYLVLITTLSVFFIIGGISLSRIPFKKGNLRKRPQHRRAFFFILIALIPYFICITGVTHQYFGEPYQIILNSKGRQYDNLFIHDQESYSSKWIKNFGDDSKIYTDFYGKFRLISQAVIAPNRINNYNLCNDLETNGYIYLRYYNVIDKKLLHYQFDLGEKIKNLIDIKNPFKMKNNIYCNGGSEVYK